MKATIKDVAAIERADIEMEPIALVVGQNEAGKTSICQAIGSTLTGDPLVFGIKTKSRLGAAIRRGASEGTCLLTSNGAQVGQSWPSGEIKSKGATPPGATAVAAGRLRPLRLDPKARIEFFMDELKAWPSTTMLTVELQDLNIGPDTIAQVLDKLKEHGWDGLWKRLKERGAKLKGAWEQITNDNYGSTKAQSWLPATWQTELEGKSKESLEAAVTKTREALEKEIANEAVSGEVKAGLERIAEGAGEAEAKKKEAQAELAKVGEELPKLREERAAIPPEEETGKEDPCPACGTVLVICKGKEGWGLREKTDEPDKAALKKQRLRVAELDGSISRLESEQYKLKTTIDIAEAAITRAENAKKELAEITNKSGGDPDAINTAREDLRIAEEHLATFVQKSDADRKHRSVVQNQMIIDVLAPDGVRKKALLKALDDLSDAMDPLGQALWKKAPRMTDTLSVEVNGFPYEALSRGARFACDTILQVALALRDGSSMVVIDDADELVGPRRAGLFKMLKQAEIYAIVAMAVSKPTQVPDLKEHNLGRTYWLEDGRAGNAE